MSSRRFIHCLAFAGLLPLLSLLVLETRADALPEESAAAPPKMEGGEGGLTLRFCREIALQRQPAIAAAQATLAAAMDRAASLDNLHGLANLARDLPVRRKQAALGIVIARGGIAQVEGETLFGVTVSYLGGVYANQQMDLAEQIRRNLDDLQKLANDPFKNEEGKEEEKEVKRYRTVVLPEHRNVVESYVATLKGRLQEAQQGEQRALAALREAMGVGCDYPLAPLPRRLPCPKVELNKEELIALALARRGELVQTANLVEVVCLEIEAQGLSCRTVSRTFASGSDIHSRPVPAGIYESRAYRPGALAPEMPTTLVGSRDDRQNQARDYLQRAQAVDAKTRQLIVLSVEDAYLRWREKSVEAGKLEKAYQEHWQFSTKLRNEIKYPIDLEKKRQPTPSYPNMDDLLHANLVTTRLLLEWKDAHYQALLALAALEQATGGGFAVDFDAAPACPEVKPPIRSQ